MGALLSSKIRINIRYSQNEGAYFGKAKKKVFIIRMLYQFFNHFTDLPDNNENEYLKFLHSEAFDEMLLKVANDDVKSFRNNNRWLIHHPNEALIFKHLENVWNELKSIYTGTFKNLVYGELPKEEAILETLKMINERLKTIIWTIKIEPMK